MTVNDSGQTVRPDRQSSTDTQADTATDDLWDSVQRVLEHVRQIDELTYFDAADVSDATDVSVQQAGTALGVLANHDDLAPGLTEWGKTRYGRTWQLAPEGSA